jgi:hypothetical protein
MERLDSTDDPAIQQPISPEHDVWGAENEAVETEMGNKNADKHLERVLEGA